MNYLSFSAEDFLLDEPFKKWILDPDPETIHFWENWLADHPQKRETIEEAKELLSLIQFRDHPLSEGESDHMWNAILAARKSPREATILPLPKEDASPSFKPGYLSRIAAVLLLSLSAALVLYLASMRQASTHYLTQYGEIKEVVLPDNSVVMLNGNSKLTIPAHWKHQVPRQVWIEGEAFFRIQKKYASSQNGGKAGGKIRFVVHTRNMDVEVLGTEFNVNNRRGKTKVMLREGKVQLSLNQVKPGARLLMAPGELVEVSPKDRLVQKKKVDPALYASWTDHKLLLDNTPLSEIASTLEDNFGYQVIISDPTHANRLVRGVLPLDDIDILLEALSTSLDLKVTKDQEKVVFESR